MLKNTSITIIGAGIVGCAIAYELSKNGYKNITVLEKNESIIGVNQSLRNGGIIHSGLYYPKDIEPLKARLCVEGSHLLYEFCRTYDVPHKKTGKLILALNQQEDAYLDFFKQIGEENGVEHIEKLSTIEAKQREPNIGDIRSALYVPITGSVALPELISRLKELAEINGAKFMFGAKVIDIDADKSEINYVTQNHSSSFPPLPTSWPLLKERKISVKKLQNNIIINAAGLYADEIAKMINTDTSYTIDPTRGEFYTFDKSTRKNIWINGMHIYPAPFYYYNDTKETVNVPVDKMKQLLKAGKITKTLGVHLSPVFENIEGSYIISKKIAIGPVKTFITDKDDYTHNRLTSDIIIKKIQPMFPHIKKTYLSQHYTGIMAVNKGFTDFIIEKDRKHPNVINLIGMDSPAWTSCLAIGRYVYRLIED